MSRFLLVSVPISSLVVFLVVCPLQEASAHPRFAPQSCLDCHGDNAAMSVTPSTLAFGKILLGRTASLSLSVNNTSTVSNDGGGFTGSFPAAPAGFGPTVSAPIVTSTFSGWLMPPPVVTKDGGSSSAQRTYSYAPTLRGSNSGSMTFTPSAGFGSPPSATIQLTGQGVAPVISLDTSAGNVAVRIGTTGSAGVKVSNIGDGNQAGAGQGNLTGAVAGSVSGFAGNGGSFSLGDGTNQVFSYAFAPTAHSVSSGTVAVNASNGSTDNKNLAQNFVVSIAGTGVGPTLSTSIPANTTIDFGQLVPSLTGATPLTVSNLTLDPNLASLTNLTLKSATITEPSGKSMYSLLGYTSGMVLSKSQVANLQLAFTPASGFQGTETATFTLVTDEGAALGASGKTISFPLTAIVADVAYWKGANGGTWNTTSPGYNWTSAADGATSLGALPGATTDIFFSAAGAATSNTTLGKDFPIHSLNFTAAAGPVTIAGSNTLTISNGITTAATSTASYAINCNLQLAGLQTWAVNGSGSLSIGGAIGGSGTFVKTGSGQLILTGSANYAGGTLVSAGELVIANPSAFANGSSLIVGNPSAFASPVVAAPEIALASGSLVSVPEPGDLTLTAAAAVLLLLRARKNAQPAIRRQRV
jgi:autotransporter-associated beta strand protein